MGTRLFNQSPLVKTADAHIMEEREDPPTTRTDRKIRILSVALDWELEETKTKTNGYHVIRPRPRQVDRNYQNKPRLPGQETKRTERVRIRGDRERIWPLTDTTSADCSLEIQPHQSCWSRLNDAYNRLMVERRVAQSRVAKSPLPEKVLEKKREELFKLFEQELDVLSTLLLQRDEIERRMNEGYLFEELSIQQSYLSEAQIQEKIDRTKEQRVEFLLGWSAAAREERDRKVLECTKQHRERLKTLSENSLNTYQAALTAFEKEICVLKRVLKYLLEYAVVYDTVIQTKDELHETFDQMLEFMGQWCERALEEKKAAEEELNQKDPKNPILQKKTLEAYDKVYCKTRLTKKEAFDKVYCKALYDAVADKLNQIDDQRHLLRWGQISALYDADN